MSKACQIVFYCFLFVLSACTKSDNKAEDYQQRVQTILETEFELPQQKALNFPRTRDINKEFEKLNKKHTISVREFLSLRECKLHIVLAQRNSLMGKVSVPSQILFNDLEILTYTPRCIEYLKQSNNLTMKNKLEVYLAEKQKEITVSLWRAILGSNENAQFWHPNDQPENYPQSLNQESVANIKALTKIVGKIKSGEYSLSKQQQIEIEQNLKGLQNGDAGFLFHQLQEQADALQVANKSIEARIKKPLCFTDNSTEKARYFRNVVNKFFIEQVQVYAVSLNQRYTQLMDVYLELESKLETGSSKQYDKWKVQRDKRFTEYLNSTKEHVQYVKKLYKQCGLQVSR